MGLLNTIRDYMLGSEIEDDEDLDDGDYTDDYEEPPVREPRAREKSREIRIEPAPPQRKRSESKIVNMPISNAMSDSLSRIVICKPEVVEDSSTICTHLQNNIICAVNLEGVDRSNAQRIADFLGGACFAIGGDIQRVSNDIFLIAPRSVTISNELKDELKSKGGGSILSWLTPAAR